MDGCFKVEAKQSVELNHGEKEGLIAALFLLKGENQFNISVKKKKKVFRFPLTILKAIMSLI